MFILSNENTSFIFIIFISVLVIAIIFRIITGYASPSFDKDTPRIKARVKIASKRTDPENPIPIDSVSHSKNESEYTKYYVCFEFESGDRLELLVDKKIYKIMANNDIGILYFRGDKYLDFERIT